VDEEDIPESPQIEKKLSFKKTENKNIMANSGTTITKNEDDEIINVEWKVYLDYFKEGFIWVALLFITFPLAMLAAWCWMTLQYLAAEWMENISLADSFSFYFWKFLLISILNIFALLGSIFTMRIYCLLIANRFFKKMANRLVEAPINLYFDVTPSGWILNRFSKDL